MKKCRRSSRHSYEPIQARVLLYIRMVTNSYSFFLIKKKTLKGYRELLYGPIVFGILPQTPFATITTNNSSHHHISNQYAYASPILVHDSLCLTVVHISLLYFFFFFLFFFFFFSFLLRLLWQCVCAICSSSQPK